MTSQSEALEFINKYGIVTLFPIRGKSFPSLYRATKGSHDERFKNAWSWADNLSFKKKIHYGKLVCKQVTLVSLEMFPYFHRVGRESRLSDIAQGILGFLKENGKTSTTGLRKNLGFMGKEKKSEFLKAVDELQMAFAIAIVDREKPPRRTHIYDLMERWMPQDLMERAELMSRNVARRRIFAKMLENEIITTTRDAEKFFTLEKAKSQVLRARR